MGEIVELCKNNSYKFAVKTVPIERLIGKRQTLDIKFQYAIIIRNLTEGVESIHNLFTTYIHDSFQNVSPNHKYNNARIIVDFLNYLYFHEDRELRIENFTQLKMDDITDYLNMKALIVTDNTLNQYKFAVKKFVYYFGMKEVLRDFPKTDIENSNINFDNIDTGIQSNNDLMHDMEASLMLLFINEARKVAPRIALGIYFQCFGGLRVSEVCNLLYSSISPIGFNLRDGAILNIKKNIMRPDLLGYDAKCRVKRVREQVVFSCEELQVEMFQYHKQHYKSKTEVDAVFVDENGMPMTNKAYRDYFNKVKISFIKTVAKFAKDVPTMKFLFRSDIVSRAKWSTHLCRGFFSNMCAAHVKTINELMVLRGDKSPESSIPYLQKSQTTKKAIDATISKHYQDLCTYEQYQNITKAYKLDIRVKEAEEELEKRRKKKGEALAVNE